MMLEQIIQKLGYDPFDYNNYKSKTLWHDDSNPNPFGVLTDEEVDFIVKTEKARIAAQAGN